MILTCLILSNRSSQKEKGGFRKHLPVLQEAVERYDKEYFSFSCYVRKNLTPDLIKYIFCCCVCVYLQRKFKKDSSIETEYVFKDGDLVDHIYQHSGKYYVKNMEDPRWKFTLKEFIKKYPSSYKTFRKTKKFLEFAKMPNHSELLNYTDDEEEAEEEEAEEEEEADD